MLPLSGADLVCFAHMLKLDMVTKLGFRKTFCFCFIPQVKLTFDKGMFYACLYREVTQE